MKDTCCNGSGIASACRHHCYVHKTREGRDGIEKRYEKNIEIAQRPDFDKLMTGAIQKSGIGHIKLHVSGDFSSTAYIEAWTVIVRATTGGSNNRDRPAGDSRTQGRT